MYVFLWPVNTNYHVYKSGSMSIDLGLEGQYVLMHLILDAFYTKSEAGPSFSFFATVNLYGKSLQLLWF